MAQRGVKNGPGQIVRGHFYRENMSFVIVSDNGLFMTEFIDTAIFEHLKENGSLPSDALPANWDTKESAERYLDT